MLCDWNIEKHTRKKYYERLNKLTPIKRFTEKFILETEALKLDIKETDEIIGWFYFDEKCKPIDMELVIKWIQNMCL